MKNGSFSQREKRKITDKWGKNLKKANKLGAEKPANVRYRCPFPSFVNAVSPVGPPISSK